MNDIETPGVPPETIVEMPSADDTVEPTTSKRRGRPKKYPPATLNPTLLSAQSIALPPSRSASPASTPPSMPDRAIDSPRLRPRSMSDSSGTSDSRIHQRSRRNSPQSSAASPASSLETEDEAELEEKAVSDSVRGQELGGHDSKTTGKIPARPRRGPTAREKKEAQRKRRVEMRRSKLGATQAKAAAGLSLGKGGGVHGRSSAKGEENVLMEVRELFI